MNRTFAKLCLPALLAMVGLPGVAVSLERAAPEALGFSAERLGRLSAVLEEYVGDDATSAAGEVDDSGKVRALVYQAIDDDPTANARSPDACGWVTLFDGKSLDGWTPKISGHALGDNYADTFRVQDGAITVSYDGYESFGGRFGHLFYEKPYTRYRLRLEYRIFGEPTKDFPEWAFRNSGVMFHSPSPETMELDQDFPASLEFQMLRGRGDGEPRPTGNLCTPGTRVVYQGETDERHCIPSSSPTIDSDGWVEAELRVLGDEKIVHYIDGEPVLEYERPTYGGPGGPTEQSPRLPSEGEPVKSGYIALQAEGHPIQFRNIQLMDLDGLKTGSGLNCANEEGGNQVGN